MSEGFYSALRYAEQFAKTKHVMKHRGKQVKDIKKGVREDWSPGSLPQLHALRHTLATLAAATGIDMRKI